MMYALVGGLGHPLAGPIVGSFVITIIPEVLRSIREYEPIVTGGITIIIIIFLPLGILNVYDRFFKPWFSVLWYKVKSGDWRPAQR